MKISISGASGKTGYRIAQEALASNYKVNLIVRKNSVLQDSLKKCQRTNLSLFSASQLDESLKGSSALLIATGARPSIDLTGPARIDAFAVKKQVESCKRVGVKRIILVSSLCAGKFFHPLNLFGLILIWKKLGEQSIEDSGLDWTIIRPGGLNEDEEGINNQGIIYSSANVQEDGSIPRRLVAKTCIEALKVNKSIGRIIEITSSPNQKIIQLKNAL
tara:strand:- start:5255 stop:5908 length:654 start_codon:yes stop_codon:yes gene_type:complete